MDYAHPKFFDYLTDYGDALAAKIDYEHLIDKIDNYRKIGLDAPEAVGMGCRKILEHVLRSFIDDENIRRETLANQINWLKRSGKISDSIAKKAHKIRTIGNQAVHESNAISVAKAQESLILLDEMLRYYVSKTDMDNSIIRTIAITDDSVFLIQSEDEMAQSRHRAKTASLLSSDPSYESQTKDAQKTARETEREIDSVLLQINELYAALVENDALNDSVHSTEVQDGLFKLDSIFTGEKQKIDQARRESVKAQEEVEKILSEYDYINILLKGDKRATPEQLDVMAYPRSSKTTSRILSINGGAGTGKTLCLLAKLIRDVESNKQINMDGTVKKALFVCFNKPLVGYVKNLLRNRPEASPYIEVVNVDSFINQLVKHTSNGDLNFLNSYTQDVRFNLQNDKAMQLRYESSKNYTLLKTSMGNIASKYPEFKDAYYFNSDSQDDTEWLNEEIIWIQNRYDSLEEARSLYPSDARTGRGTKRRPDATTRLIILEIFEDYEKQLAENNAYTIEQAVKRLNESDQLPKYDSIAIDEAQDFSLRSIKLLLKMRKGKKSYFYISGDEGQKIYQRDFTWKQLGDDVKGYTITLKENKRNSPAITHFANRLLEDSQNQNCVISNKIYVMDRTDEEVLNLISRLTKLGSQTTAAIGFSNALIKNYQHQNFEHYGPFKNKGLEFDNVIIDCSKEISDDYEEEKRLRYVHFTRARMRLYVRYHGTPPRLLKEFYSDFLE